MNGLYKTNKESINVNDIDKLLGNIELIDIREENEYNEGSIKTAKNIPMRELLMNPEDYMDMDNQYYLLCRSGSRSAMACMQLREEGYDVVNVSGGIMGYTGSNMINK